MVKTQEFFFPSASGKHQCFAMEWLPENSPRGIVQIVHGVAEYIKRYDAFARFLAENGFLVCGNDHLGHGNTVTDGKYGYFAPEHGWEYVTKDVRQLREIEGGKYPHVPYFMLGHSMGSFLTRTYLINYPDTLTGAILSGTGQEPGFKVAAARLIAAIACKTKGPESHSALIQSLSLDAYNKEFAPNRTRADWISRDTAVVDAYCKDPFCSFSPTAGMFGDMMGGIKYIAQKDNLARMEPKTPVYFFSGACDPVGASGKGVRTVVSMFQDAGCKDVTLKLYPEGRHEMLNETNHEEVYGDTLAWLEAHL
ncbi:MAG: alpha/beta hydrolase [Oscillospiraceae bacterium]